MEIIKLRNSEHYLVLEYVWYEVTPDEDTWTCDCGKPECAHIEAVIALLDPAIADDPDRR